MAIGRGATVKLRWELAVVDHGAGQKLLAQDRAIRKSLQLTDAQQRKTAATASAASAKQTAGSKRVAVWKQAEARAATEAASATTALAGAQTEQAATARRVTVMSRQVVAGYNAEAAAAKRAAAAERSRATTVASAGRRARGASVGAAGAAGAVGGAVRGIATPLVGGGIGAGLALRQVVQFDRAMRNVNSIAQVSEKRFQGLSRRVRDLAGPTAQAPKVLAEGLYDLVSSGFNASDSMVILRKSAQAATAGMTTAETATAAVAGVLNAYQLPASKAGLVSDQLFRTVDRGVISFEQLAQNIGPVLPLANTLGVGLDQVGASIATLTKRGISAPETITSINAVMTALIKPSKDAQAAMDKLGAKGAQDLIEKSGGLQGALEALIGTTDGSTESIAGLFRNIRAQRGVFGLTGKNAREAAKDIKGMQDASGATGKALAQQSKSLSLQWDRLKARASALSLTVGTKLVPAFSGLLHGVGRVMSGKGRVGGFFKDLSAGLHGVDARQITRGPGGRVESVQGPSAAAEIGGRVRSAVGGIADAAVKLGPILAGAGTQLVDAFRPALPFLQNVLLPLLKGIGTGVLVSVVGAFKALTGVVKVIATGLGAIGRVAAPLKPIFQGVGTAVGFALGGPILKGISLVGKLGGTFKLVAAAAKVMAAPIRLVGAAVSGVGRLVGNMAERLSGPGRKAFATIASAATLAVGTLRGTPGRMLSAARGIVGAVGRGLATVGRVITSPFRRGLDAALGVARGFGSKLFDIGKWLIARLAAGLRRAAGGLGRAIGSAAGFIGNIGQSIRNWINDKTLLGNEVRINLPVGPDIHFTLPKIRRGGRLTRRGVQRFQDGGMVPAAVSPGELVEYGGRSWIVPGRPEPRDSVLMGLPVGARVFTFDGQARLAAGESPASVLRSQAPHFARGGLVKGAFETGMQAGQEGAGRSGVLGDLRTQLEAHKRKSKTLGGGASGLGNAPAAVGAMFQRATAIAARKLPYTYGGGHNAFGVGNPGFDCSGYVSAILGPRVLPSPMAVREPMAGHLAPGAGRWVSVGIRGTSGRGAHTMIRLGRSYFESGGKHGPARVGGWNGRFQLFHPRGFRTGGVTGKQLTSATRTAAAAPKKGPKAGQLFGRLDDMIHGAAEQRLLALRRTVLAEVRKPGDLSKLVVKRLRAVVSLIEGELGRRVGRITQGIADRTDRRERGQARADRALRRRGIDPDSSRALAGGLLAAATTGIPSARYSLRDAERALKRARRGGASRATLRELGTAVKDAQDSLDEALTSQAERRRDYFRALAQERVDASQFGVDVYQNVLAGMDANQRLTRTADTPQGMRERAGAIQQQLLPALRGSYDAAVKQFQTLTSIGDTAGARQAFLAIQQAGTDIANAMADAADLVRDAALQAAQATVDVSAHRSTMADLGLQRLELEQRLAGTYDAGAQARADYIQQTIVSALNAELAALRDQQAEANRQGDPTLARQVAEAIAGKQNELLQAQVDAMEQVAKNTDTRQFGGTLGFSFGGEVLTDSLVTIGNGV